jgi:ribosome-binding factor A
MSIKQDRVSGRIRTILSELLLREVADPRLHHITITEVELDPELLYARVYVNALGDEARQEDVMQGLERAKGFLRREVGKRVRLRKTPELVFRWDETLERSERINQLIASLDIPPADDATQDVSDDDR